MNQQALGKIVADLEVLIHERAPTEDLSNQTDTAEKTIERCMDIGKLRAAQEILKSLLR